MTPGEIDQNYLIQISHPTHFPAVIKHTLQLEDDFSGIGTISPYHIYANQP